MIEGEEDIDRDRKIRRSAPEHLAEQIKLREGSVVSTFDILSVIGNFIVGFRKAEASGVAFRGILRTTSRSPKTRQPDIRKWLTGERRNHSKLASALRKRIPDRSADVDAMVKEKSLKRFCDAIEWCWADQGIEALQLGNAFVAEQMLLNIRNATATQRHVAADIKATAGDARTALAAARRGEY